jgi:hypothetical protein
MRSRVIPVLLAALAGAALAGGGFLLWRAFASEDDSTSEVAVPTSSTAQPAVATTTTLALVDEFDVPAIGHVQCRGIQVYVVARGDALLGIVDDDAVVQLGEGLRDGQGFVTIVRRVAAANGIAEVDQIQAGQHLSLPVRCDITEASIAPEPATTTTLPPEFLFSFELNNGIGYCRGPVAEATVGERDNFYFLVEREVGFIPPLNLPGNPERLVAAIALELNDVEDWGDLDAGSRVLLPQKCGVMQ